MILLWKTNLKAKVNKHACPLGPIKDDNRWETVPQVGNCDWLHYNTYPGQHLPQLLINLESIKMWRGSLTNCMHANAHIGTIPS